MITKDGEKNKILGILVKEKKTIIKDLNKEIRKKLKQASYNLKIGLAY